MHGPSIKLTPQILLSAYIQGIFPMAHDDGEIYWHDPDPRAIFPFDTFHIPRRLQRTVRNTSFTVTRNTAFRDVIEACAAVSDNRESTWIDATIVDAYCELHRLGFAHSVETWDGDTLVGGLYGVAIRGLFAGESMFSQATDASKIALVHLVTHLRARGFTLLDAQFDNPHLQQFGLTLIPRDSYHEQLANALEQPATFDSNQ